ncbi:MAG: homoserine kinase [Spirochaetota bacterium]
MDPMVASVQISIKVPGTSANLGPGFDLMGIALQVYNQFYFTLNSSEKFTASFTDGSPLPFSRKDDLVLSSYQKYFSLFLSNEKSIPYHVDMQLELPLKGGLGSSASAVVAGFVLGRKVHQLFFPNIVLPSEEDFLFHLAQIEGHPDNTIPAYLGNFVFSYSCLEDKRLHRIQKTFPDSIALFLLLPKLEVETNTSRRTLPSSYSRNDVIFNMSRIATWFSFLETGEFSSLCRAVEDKVHSPYRLQNFPILQCITKEILANGACFSLSGSGPTLLIYCEKKNADDFYTKLQEFTQKIADEVKIAVEVQKIQVDTRGTSIEVAP